jgi:LacI family transcriptional regulator, galactose operon repressor
MAATGRPTIYDVARLAGVSTATVSRALNGTGQISPATRKAIEEAVEKLGYRPNTIARSLVKRSTQTIAVMFPDIGDPFYPALIKGVQALADEQSYTILLCTAEGDPEREESYLNLLRAKQVDGALVDGLVLPRSRIAPIVDEGFPIVSLDRDIDFPSIPLVQVDNRLGGRLATEHLLELGHRRIAHISGRPELRHSEERLSGYRDALADAGVDVDPSLVDAGGFTEAGGYRAMQELLERDPSFTAVFAVNDVTAVGALRAIRESGRRVPEDLSVVGFDDLWLAAYLWPPLTTVRQPLLEIGRRATEILLEVIRGERKSRRVRHILKPELIVRESTAPARQRGERRA